MASVMPYGGDTVLHQQQQQPPMKLKGGKRQLLHQQLSPDSTNNNNNTIKQEGGPMYVAAPAPRGRGRKAAQTFVQVIPGQPISVARRNARERNRVKQVNNGFANLRQHIPFTARNKKMSKVETLRCAVDYIRSMQHLLDENGGYHVDLHNPDSTSPMSMLDDDDDEVSGFDTSSHPDTLPSSSSLMVEDFGGHYASEAAQQLPQQLVMVQQQGSSLSPGYSDRSSTSPGAVPPGAEVTSTGFMGVFAAAAAGLVKDSGSALQVAMGLKKEAMDAEEECKLFQHARYLQMDTGAAEVTDAHLQHMMQDTNLWWELEQRRMQQHTA